LAGVPSSRTDGFLALSEGRPLLSQAQVEMHRNVVGGVRVLRGMFSRNAVLNQATEAGGGGGCMTFPQLLAQVYPSMWKEFVLRVEHCTIPLDALRGYERAFDRLDEGGTGHLSLERMKAAQKKMQSALASGAQHHQGVSSSGGGGGGVGSSGSSTQMIPHPSNSYERLVVAGVFKCQGRWLVADISVTVLLMKQIDRTRSGFVSFPELMRAAFPNVACHASQERLNPSMKFESACRCCICEYCASNSKFMRPKPVSPYLDGSVLW
jgi:hypothetical protein